MPRTTFTAVDPAQHSFTLTATYTLKDWRELRRQMLAGRGHAPWPSSVFIDEISSMIAMAEKVYYAPLPPPEETSSAD